MPSAPYFAILFRSMEEKDNFKRQAMQHGYGYGLNQNKSLSSFCREHLNAIVCQKKERFQLILVILNAIKRMKDEDFNDLLVFLDEKNYLSMSGEDS